MIKSDSNYKNLVAIIREGDEDVLKEAIESLRQEEPFEGAIGLLADLYNSTDNKVIRANIASFFNDIKDNSVKEEIINEIGKPYSSETTRMLISSCWQSGLDYSAYLKDFADIFVTADYLTAIECMSVIESLIERADEEMRQELCEILDNVANDELSDLAGDLQADLK